MPLATIQADRGCWIADFYATVDQELGAFISGRLRNDLYSRFGVDICQDVFLLMLEKLDSPPFVGVDSANWHTAERLELLRQWAFNAARLLTYKAIRESQRCDYGGKRFDLYSVVSRAIVREDDEKPNELLAECPVRGASVFERMILTDATDAELASELGISEVGVRVIRCRVRKWFQQRHRD